MSALLLCDGWVRVERVPLSVLFDLFRAPRELFVYLGGRERYNPLWRLFYGLDRARARVDTKPLTARVLLVYVSARRGNKPRALRAENGVRECVSPRKRRPRGIVKATLRRRNSGARAARSRVAHVLQNAANC